MDWQFTNDRPIYLQIAEQIVQQIAAGGYPPGERLPSVRDLAAQAGVNPNTMQRAFGELEREGLVLSNRTAGRIVTEDMMKIEEIRRMEAQKQIEAFLSGMKQLGYTGEQAAQLLEQYALSAHRTDDCKKG